MRSDARRPLAIAEDVVDRNIAAATRDIALAPVIDDERRVGKPAVQRFELHLAAPAWQRGDSCFEIEGHHPVQEQEFGAVNALGCGMARRCCVAGSGRPDRPSFQLDIIPPLLWHFDAVSGSGRAHCIRASRRDILHRPQQARDQRRRSPPRRSPRGRRRLRSGACARGRRSRRSARRSTSCASLPDRTAPGEDAPAASSRSAFATPSGSIRATAAPQCLHALSVARSTGAPHCEQAIWRTVARSFASSAGEGARMKFFSRRNWWNVMSRPWSLRQRQ